MTAMHVSAKVDYGMRALLVIAQESGASGALIKGDHLASERAFSKGSCDSFGRAA